MGLKNSERLKNAEKAAEFREKLLADQGGKDPILGIDITNPVLDHQHFPPYNCRQVLQSEVNAFEGKIYNAYRRYLKHLSNQPLPEVLRALATYLEGDYSEKPKHHTAIQDELRPFKRANAETQIRILNELSIEPAKNTSKRVRQMRAAILAGQITFEELVIKARK